MSSSSSSAKAKMGEGDSSKNNNNNNNKRASIPSTTTITATSDNKKQKVVSTSATATSILSSTATITSIIGTVKVTTTDNIAELKSENTRLQKLVNTQQTELATKEAECQRLRDENKLLKGRVSSSSSSSLLSSSSSVAVTAVKEGPAATTTATVEKVLSIRSELALSPSPAPVPAITVEDTCISSSAVADVIVAEGIHNGILSKILDYVATTTPSKRNNINNDDNDGNETVMPAGKTTTRDALIILTLVSKRFHRIISTHEENGTKKWKLIPLFVLSPLKNNGGNTINFLHTMNQYQQNDESNKKLQQYLLFKVYHIDKFDHVPDDYLTALIINLRIRMKGIRSLNMSLLPSSTTVRMNHSLSRALARIMPNLRELNLSHTNFNADNNILVYFSLACPLLEKLTWTNIKKDAVFMLDGFDLKDARNLQEINMDESYFVDLTAQEVEMSDLNNHPSIFIFHECGSTVLERISIRNTKYYQNDNTYSIISQTMLIKFIRNAPATLKWFRSDLTQENIEMLTKERPGIQLLN